MNPNNTEPKSAEVQDFLERFRLAYNCPDVGLDEFVAMFIDEVKTKATNAALRKAAGVAKGRKSGLSATLDLDNEAEEIATEILSLLQPEK